MAKYIYSLILFLFTPFLVGYTIWKYRQEGFSADLLMRVGFKMPSNQTDSVWMHACSLGEAKVAIQLADELLSLSPDSSIQFTSTTPAGLKYLMSDGRAVAVFPWDFRWIWRRWIRAMRPRALVLIETELWPNLIHVCRTSGIPVVLANGRLSQKSFQDYLIWSAITKPMWKSIDCALMQAKEDANRAKKLGVLCDAVSEVGSIKLDQEIAPIDPVLSNQLTLWKGGRHLLCLMSSHPEDDKKILEAFAQSRLPFWALVIVPRHPVRGSKVAKIARNLNLATARVSTGLSESSVLVGDTFGQMSTYLDAADIVIIGGTFSGKGGQNPIEAALLKKPLIAGPSMFNFQSIADALIDCGGLLQIQSHQIIDAIRAVDIDGRKMGEASFTWVIENRGSTQLQATAILNTARKVLD